MEKQIKTIGVLTSGGDAPGMNAAVRAVVRTGLHKGFRMIGIQRGYNGLLNGECFEMNLRSVSNIISAGGTIPVSYTHLSWPGSVQPWTKCSRSASITACFFLLMARRTLSACPNEKPASSRNICMTCSW